MATRVIAACLATLLLAACNQPEPVKTSSAPSAQPAAAAESFGQQGPCSWLTDTEISQNLGQPMKSTVEPVDKKNCNVDPTDKTGRFKFWYRVADNTGAYSFMSAFQSAVAITNLGDKAVWDKGSIAAVKGKRCVSVAITPVNGAKMTDEEQRHTAATIANVILSRM